jgi:ribosome recycling factor
MPIKEKLEKTIQVLQSELRSLRVGRASIDMVEDLEVNVYGAKMSLNQVASITLPQANQILIQPWDPANLETIANSIQKSDIQLNPVIQSNAIRLTMPSLTEEDRQKVAKEAASYAERARVSVRNMREEAMKDIETKEKAKEISQDDKFRQEKETQKLIDEYNKKIQNILETKEREILG